MDVKNLDLSTLRYIKSSFDIYSDMSTKCQGYNRLIELIVEKTKSEGEELKGNPNCKLCHGKGEYSFSTFDGRTTVTKTCSCIIQKMIKND